MKLTLNSYENQYTIETTGDDLNIVEMANMFRGLLVQAGFHPASVESIFAEDSGVDNWNLEIASNPDPHEIANQLI